MDALVRAERSGVKHSSFRLTDEARDLLSRLARHFGLNRTKVLEWLIREKARDCLSSRRKRRTIRT